MDLAKRWNDHLRSIGKQPVTLEPVNVDLDTTTPDGTAEMNYKGVQLDRLYHSPSVMFVPSPCFLPYPNRLQARRFEPDDFRAEGGSHGQLWDRNQDDIPSTKQHHSQTPQNDEPMTLIKQPETRAISQEQLVAEVKGIYAGLVMVESKCIEVVETQWACDGPTKLSKDQWHALIALHRTLLHEPHDFFLASQHPSMSPALERLAAKYAMLARMWRHGIHSFLELLRHRLPASLEHMLTFVYLAYSMMALLETVSGFEDTWIECPGDLGRYRMAIEDDDIRDREHWASVSRHWYLKASDKAPATGRLYYHLAILGRRNVVSQPFYYSKSLCAEGDKCRRGWLEKVVLTSSDSGSPQPSNPEALQHPGSTPHYGSRAYALAVFAIFSFGTAITSWLLGRSDDTPTTPSPPPPLPPAESPQPDRVTLLYVRIALIVASALNLVALIAGYSLWFLSLRPDKARAFVGMAAVCAIVLWFGTRGGDSEDNNARNLPDTANLIGLFAVMMGILNAESRLMAALCTQGGGNASDDDDRQDEHADGSRAPLNSGDTTSLALVHTRRPHSYERSMTTSIDEGSREDEALVPPTPAATLAAGTVRGAPPPRNGARAWTSGLLARLADGTQLAGLFTGLS
ncbi:hypothetical protein VTJ49DRAFT_6584 [Mycothermus thermophilus]|uniref:DNA/RNA-binding domain-containing protein n=1 Tax=Humicola insolens TaxID=85995 RepID=A0ABR3V1B0_HUMIN